LSTPYNVACVNYRVGHEKVAHHPFCTCPCYCINYCIYAMLQTWATFSWPTLYLCSTMAMYNLKPLC